MDKLFGSLGFIVFCVVLAVVAANGFYVVEMTEQVIVTQGGKPVGEPVSEAGLHFKVPFLHRAMRVEKYILEWDGPAAEMPTKDKTNIIVDAFARWRIADPLAYLEANTDRRSALSRLDDIIGSEVLKTVGSHDAAELIRSTVGRVAQKVESGAETPGEVGQLRVIKQGRDKIEEEIQTRAEPKLRALGIELLDVRLKRVNYQPEVQSKIYARMISERARIAERFRSEGAGEAERILGQMEKEIKEIDSTAYREVETIKGAADAQAARIYAEAYSSTGEAAEFYEFLQTMDIYRTILSQDTTLVLSTDSDLFQYLKSMNPGSRKDLKLPGSDPAGELPLFLRDPK